MSRAGKIYCRRIRKRIVGTRREKAVFLEPLKGSVEEYQQEHPDATLAELCDHFGKPETIANDYISTLDDEFVRKRLFRAKAIRIGVIIVAAIAAVALGAICAIMLHSEEIAPQDSGEVTIIYQDGYTQEEVAHFYE